MEIDRDEILDGTFYTGNSDTMTQFRPSFQRLTSEPVESNSTTPNNSRDHNCEDLGFTDGPCVICTFPSFVTDEASPAPQDEVIPTPEAPQRVQPAAAASVGTPLARNAHRGRARRQRRPRPQLDDHSVPENPRRPGQMWFNLNFERVDVISPRALSAAEREERKSERACESCRLRKIKVRQSDLTI